MIEKGLPGEGNILLFDNGRVIHKGRSFAIELNPETQEIEWIYDAGKKFFSNSAGSLQRLPNGNTFLSEDTTGRILEVTKSGETVWEYKGNLRVARARRYELNYCPNFQDLKPIA